MRILLSTASSWLPLPLFAECDTSKSNASRAHFGLNLEVAALSRYIIFCPYLCNLCEIARKMCSHNILKSRAVTYIVGGDYERIFRSVPLARRSRAVLWGFVVLRHILQTYQHALVCKSGVRIVGEVVCKGYAASKNRTSTRQILVRHRLLLFRHERQRDKTLKCVPL